jgi:hypothetical protein
MLRDRAGTFYYSRITGRPYDFITMVAMVKEHFETEENRQFYMSEWRETTLPRVITSNPTKSKLECLNFRRSNEVCQQNIRLNIASETKLSVHAEALKNAILHCINLRTHLKEYVLDCGQQLVQQLAPGNYVQYVCLTR